MRRKGTDQQLAERRAQGLVLLEQGKTPSKVAELLNVTRRSVNRWQQAARKRPRKKESSQRGRPRKLSPRQEKRLEKALDKGAYTFGYAGEYWTLDRIGQVIWQLFGVRYHPSGVWHVLVRMGWSCQRPQRRDLRRDEPAIAQWKAEVLPEIKKVA
jgi:transposase